MNIDLSGKKILVLGVANDKSIAWGIAKALHNAGADLLLTYLNEAIEKRVRPLAEQVECSFLCECDVQSDESLDRLFAEIQDKWGVLDGIVHSVAFASADDLKNRFSETTREGFHLALDVSAYSLVAVAGRARRLMSNGGSIITLTYLGSQRVVSNYKVMGVAKAALEASVKYLAYDLGGEGIRVNAISAGPIRTLAASGISKFREMLKSFSNIAPIKRNITQDDVANTALFFMSDLSSAITGEITYVDGGYNIMDSLSVS